MVRRKETWHVVWLRLVNPNVHEHWFWCAEKKSFVFNQVKATAYRSKSDAEKGALLAAATEDHGRNIPKGREMAHVGNLRIMRYMRKNNKRVLCEM